MKQTSLFKQFFLLVLLLVGSATGAWAEETIATFTASTYNGGTTGGWAVNSANYATASNGYYQLISSDASIVTPSINWSDYTDITITITARKYGGPDSTQGKISVNQGNTELASYSPTGTSIASSGPLEISPTGTSSLSIACLGASNNKGCGVQTITIKGTLATTTPSISAANVNIDYNETAGTIESTINNPVVGGVLTAAKKTTADWLTLGSVSGTNVPFITTENDGNEDREATVTLTYTYNTSETVTKDVTITQGHFVVDYATLPFAFDSGKSAIESTSGLTHNGLGSDYSSSPKLKFDGTGDYLILKINEDPGVLSFDIKGNNFSGGTFKVQASSDGENYSDVATYTSLGDTENQEIDNLASTVRYIKWIYTTKSSGNVALGNISLEKPVAPKTTTTTTIDASGITNTNLDEGTAAGQLTASVKAGETPVGGATVTWTSSDEKVATVDAEGIVTLKKKGTTTITATYAGDETYASSSGTYNLTVKSEIQPTAIVSDFNYSTIGSGEGAELSKETAIDLDGVMMTLDKGNNSHYPRGDADYIRFYQHNTMKLEAPAGYVITSVEFTEPSTNRAWSNLDVDAGTYTNEGNGNGGSWEGVTSTLTFTGKDGACRMAGINITLAPGTNVTDAEWATYVTPKDIDFAASTGVKAYKVTGTDGKIELEEVTEAPKGTPLVIAAEEAGYVFAEAASAPAAVTGNLLKAADGTQTGNGAGNFYVLGKDNQGKVGFGPLGDGVTLAVGKAYIDGTEVTAKGFLPFVIGDEESETTSISEELRVKSEESSSAYNLSGQRVSKDYKGIVVVNGKKFVRK